MAVSVFIALLNWHWGDCKQIKKRDASTIYTDANIFDNLLNHIKKFYASEAEYARLGKRYKKGIMLKGPPGTGKSSVINALASSLNKSVGFISLDNMVTDQMMYHLIDQCKADFLVFEDIDAQFSNRATEGKAKSHFHHFLILSMDGV